jgi:hypothetical protein
MAQETQPGDSGKSLCAAFFRPSGCFSGRGAAVVVHCRAKTAGGVITERAMWPHVVVILTPQLEFLPDISQRKKYIYIQTFVAQPAVE